MFGQRFLHQEDLEGLTFQEQEHRVKANAEYMIRVYSALEYSIIPIHYLDEEWIRVTAQHIRSLVGDTFMLTTKGDGTLPSLKEASLSSLSTALPMIPSLWRKKQTRWLMPPLSATNAILTGN